MKRHIVCFGDSNTHGLCADPLDSADLSDRYNESERWTCLVQKMLGDSYLILEEGMNGRTTVFDDPLEESLSGIDAIYSVLMSHKPVDLLIIMLGTNDTKDRFGASAACIGYGMDRLIQKAQSTECWRDGIPHILVIAPPHIRNELSQIPEGEEFGEHSSEKSKHIASKYQHLCQMRDCFFLDAEQITKFNSSDCIHLTKEGHKKLAEQLAVLIPTLF